MSLFDIISLCIIGGFALFGLWFGLVNTLGSLVGTILGVFLASRWYEPVAGWLMNLTGWTGNFPKVVTFILAFLIINRLVGFAFYLIDKAFSIITRLPIISGLNRLLGGVFGIAEGVIVLGITFYFINKFPLGTQFMTQFSTSTVAPFCIHVASILWPLIPQAIQQIQNALHGII